MYVGIYFFFGEVVFFLTTFGLVVLGLGVFGFFVGDLVVLFTFDGDLGLAIFAEVVFFFSKFALFFVFAGLDAIGFLPVVFVTLTIDDFDFVVADLFGLAAGTSDDFFVTAVDDNLNEPLAPLPFVCTSAPDATLALIYFLMNGANFSASTLYVAELYFLIA